MPFNAPFATVLNASLIALLSHRVLHLLLSQQETRLVSVHEVPYHEVFHLNVEELFASAFAAPVVVGIIDCPQARALLKSLCGLSIFLVICISVNCRH